MPLSNHSDRKITYRDGWRRGTIGPDKGKNTSILVTILDRIVWREAPFIPSAFLGYALWALAGIGFTGSVVLVYALGHAPQG
jgi:hypothetical protein